MSDTQEDKNPGSGADDANESSKLDGTSNSNALVSNNGGIEIIAGTNSTLNNNAGGNSTLGPDKGQNAELKKIGGFPSDLSNIKPIFSLKSKNEQAKERFNQKAQDYLDSHKMSIYLQDAIKIILDRREEKPIDLLTDYFNTTLKGEHILLREYAFVSATQLNRKCFLQQIRKVFHSTPYYHTITGLDYHQMICLICSDFPRNLMIETIKTLPLAKSKNISQKNGTEILFEEFELDKLQSAVCIYFFYNEFMENVRTAFQEAQSAASLNPEMQVSLMLVYTSINNLVNRLRNSSFPLPPIEAIVEVLLTKTDAEEKMKDQPLVIISDMITKLSGNTMSYVEFSQGMLKNKTLLNEIYDPIFNKKIFQAFDQLKEIAAEQAAGVGKEQMKKNNKKKITKQTTKN